MSRSRLEFDFKPLTRNSIVQDLCIWLVPVPMLWKLQVSNRQKAGVIFLFCIGIVALVGML